MNSKFLRSVVIVFATLIASIAPKKATSQSVDFQIANYSAIPSTSITYTIQVKATGTIAMPSISIEMNTTNVTYVTGFTSLTFASNYSGYSTSPTFSSPTLTANITAPGSPTTISTSGYEDLCTITMVNSGSALDVTDIVFNNITGVTVGSSPSLSSQFLPINLMYFSGRNSNGNIILKWASAEEEKANFFKIQRSMDGIHFQDIGGVEANSSGEYIFIDNFGNSGINLYYRLTTENRKNKIEYSKILHIKLEENKMQISPNPFTGSISVKDKYDYFVIYNPQGKIVYESKDFQESINLESLPLGIYFLKTKESEPIKLVKIDY